MTEHVYLYHLTVLEAKETEYKKVSSGLAWWAIILIILACLIALAGVAYLVMFFLINQWIKKNDKAIRVFKVGVKDGEVRLLTMNLRIVYVDAKDVYKTKADALK